MPLRRPKRPKQHELEDKSRAYFKYTCPDDWVVNKLDHDYGRDLLVTITEEGSVLSDEFSVQLKASGELQKIAGGKFISKPISVSTVEYLRELTYPALIFAYDEKENKGYWVWLNKYLEDIQEKKPDWRNQETLTIRIPTANEWKESSFHLIQDYVKDFASSIRKVRPLVNEEYRRRQVESPTTSRQEIAHEFVDKLMALQDAEDIAYIPSTVSPNEAHFTELLSEARGYIRSYNIDSAENTLETASKVQSEDFASDRLADFHNLTGLTYFFREEFHQALQEFSEARNLNPDEVKYHVNLVRGLLATSPLSDKCDEESRALIKQHPEDWRAQVFRAQAIAARESRSTAIAFLKSYEDWDSSIELVLGVAGMLLEEGNLDEAENVLKQFSVDEDVEDARYWMLIGTVHLYQSSSQFKEGRLYVRPKDLDPVRVRFAIDAYDKAIALWRKGKNPEITDILFVNYIMALGLADNTTHSIDLTKEYISQGGESPSVLQNAGVVALNAGLYPLAAKWFSIVRSAKPSDETSLLNLIRAQMAASQYNKVISILSDESIGEIKFSIEVNAEILYHLALAYYRQANDKFYTHKAKELRKLTDPSPPEHFLLQEEIACTEGKSEGFAYGFIERGLGNYPNHVMLLRRKIAHLIGIEE